MTNSLHRNEASSPTLLRNPIVYFIFLVEVAERFAYYGFRAILILYLIRSLNYTETTAIALYGYNSSLTYFTPLLGAYLADDHMGRYATILSLGTLYAMGLLLLTFATTLTALSSQRIISFLGLFLICVGTGGIKPCVSSFGADQLTPPPSLPVETRDDTEANDLLRRNSEESPNEELRVYFNYFYFCINLGALSSIAVIPWVRAYAGFTAAFGIPFFCMILALAVFWSQRQRYVHVHNDRTNDDRGIWNTCQIMIRVLCQQIQSQYPSGTFGHDLCRRYMSRRNYGRPETMDRNHKSSDDWDESNGTNDAPLSLSHCERMEEEAVQILHILPIFAMFPIYSCLYDQQGSVWTLQATKMYLPWKMQPEQMNMINPILIMILIPLFDRILYPFLQRYTAIPPLRLMSWGMFLTALAFFCSGIVESAIQSHQEGSSPVHVMWQLPQIVLLAVGEIFLSVTGLEFAYAQSPVRFKALVSALYLSTTGMGDLLAGLLYSTVFSHMNRAVVMHVCAVMMLVNLCLFVRVAHWYQHRPGRQHSYAKVETTASGVELLTLGREID